MNFKHIITTTGIIFSTLLLGMSAAQAQPVAGLQRLQMAAADTALARGAVQQVQGTTWVDATITVADQAAFAALRQAGVQLGTTCGNVATARIPLSAVSALTGIEGLSSVQLARQAHPLLDKARPAGHVDEVLQGTATGISQPYTGQGVIVGVVDRGFDLTHVSLYDNDTHEYRVKRLWMQDLDTVSNVKPFGYGMEFSDPKAITKLVTDYQYGYHGTHVLGIAAGGDTKNTNPYYGIAPKADIVLVSCSGSESKILDGVAYIFNYADAVGKPAVVNLSWGSMLGPHDGTSACDRMLDGLQGPGHLIVGAAGNSEGAKVHISHEFNFAQRNYKTGLKFDYIGKHQIIMAELWGSKDFDGSVSLYVFDKSYHNVLAEWRFVPLDSAGTTQFSYVGRPSAVSDTLKVKAIIETGVNAINGLPHATIAVEGWGVNDDRYFIGLKLRGLHGNINGWADGYYSVFNAMGDPDAEPGDSHLSVAELGGTGKRIISVGAFNSKNAVTYQSGNNSNVASSYPLGEISYFSSEGPTLDGRVKPDVCAPGALIVSAFNRHYYNFSTDNMVGTSYNSILGTYDYYGVNSGTSMSAPFVAGVLALWLQAVPTLTPEQAREAIQATAINDDFTGQVRDSGDGHWGYGKIDAAAGLTYLLGKYSGIDETGVASRVNAFVVRSQQGSVSIVPTATATGVSISLYDLNGRQQQALSCPTLQAGTPINVSTAGLTPGIYLLRLSTDAKVQTLKVVVQ